MKSNYSFILQILIIILLLSIVLERKYRVYSEISSVFKEIIGFRKVSLWDEAFKTVKIESPNYNGIEKAIFYRSDSEKLKPLIVSLHTWDGDFTEYDPLSVLAKKHKINYIHPNFYGPNNTSKACCSDAVIERIDASIDYAIENSNVDTSKIYIVGASGGGYATIAMLMKTRHNIAKFSSWVPITNLISFYNESRLRGNGYDKDILKCTNSEEQELDTIEAKKRSPLFWKTPIEKIENTKISIYAGVNDGIKGSVPISHSINFYNKLVEDLESTDTNSFVSLEERVEILETRQAIGNFKSIGDRKVLLHKKHKSIELLIFDGGHEILSEFAFNSLINDD